MGQLSNSIHAALLDHVFSANSYTPGLVYASLHSSDPGDTGANEVGYTNYSGAIRPLVFFTNNAASRTITHDDVELVFPVCGGGPVTATYYGLWSSSTVGAGTFIGGGILITPLVITQGNIPKLNGAEISMSFNVGSTTGITNYLAEALLNLVFKESSLTQPVIALSLHTTTCSDSGPGTECVGTNYARKAVTAWDAATAAGGVAYLANTNEELFPTPSDETWGTVVAVGILDSTTDELLYYGNDVVDTPIVAAVAVKVEAGALVVTAQ